MKKSTHILCVALLITFFSGAAMASPVDITIRNFEVAGFYSLSGSAIDSTGNPIDASNSDTLMRHVVLTYVDNLIAWGDALFRQDTTGEPVDTASVYMIGNQYIVVERTSWEWLKDYRIWEANNKEYLYPENWIEPEVRDDTGPFLILGVRPESVPEVSEARAAFFEHLRNTWYADMSASPVPEPSVMLLLGSGLMGLFFGRKFFLQ